MHGRLPCVAEDETTCNAANEGNDEVGEAEFGFADAVAALSNLGDSFVGEGAAYDAVDGVRCCFWYLKEAERRNLQRRRRGKDKGNDRKAGPLELPALSQQCE